MHFTGNSAIKAGIGAGVLALMIGGGAFAASALSATPGASTDATSAAQSDTPVPAVLGEFEDVWRGEVRVGYLRRADADAWPDFVDGEVRYPGYPNIGVDVHDDNGVMIGYRTAQYGFVYLDEVDRYNADLRGFLRARAAESGIPVPEGWG